MPSCPTDLHTTRDGRCQGSDERARAVRRVCSVKVASAVGAYCACSIAVVLLNKWVLSYEALGGTFKFPLFMVRPCPSWGEPSPGADVAGVSPVSVQMWQG